MSDELTPKETEKKDGTARRWLRELEESDKRFSRFLKEAKECNEGYIGSKEDDSEKASRYMAIFWSNLETLSPALYSQAPKPLVSRRFKTADPVARKASELLERNLSYFAQPEYFDPIARRDVMSYLRVGLAIDWVRYISKVKETRVNLRPMEGSENYLRDDDTEVNPSEIELVQDDEGAYFNEAELEYEDVGCDKVHYADIRWGRCVDWDEAPWVARRIRMRKDAAVERFGKDKAEDLCFASKPRSEDEADERDEEQKAVFPQAEIWEIWSKEDKTVYWVSKGVSDLLDKKADPLKLTNFFPCPKPLLASHTDDSLIPRADFIIYRKQLDYVELLTQRIHTLTDALLVKGVYDASAPELADLLDSSTEKEMIPVENFALFMEKGGLEQMVKFLPIEQIAKVLQILISLRREAINDIYETTGMSDILRGASDPRETATAQRVKGQFAAVRMRDRQKEVQRYLRDILAIKAEIIAEHFDPETILAIADSEPDQITQQALILLKTDKLRAFRIDIETDSTITADDEADKAAANEFLMSVTGFLDKALLFSERAPAYAPVMGEFLMFMVRRYRAGRTLEESIETASQQHQMQLQQMAQQPPPPDPKMMAAQQQMQITQAKSQQDAQLKQIELQQRAQSDQAELQLGIQKAETDAALKKYEIDLEHDRKMAEIRAKALTNLNPFTA